MNSVRTMVSATFVVATLLFAAHGQREEVADRALQLEARVDSLRIEGKFQEALVSAKQLFGLTRSDESARPYQLADAERLVSTLEFILTLSTEDQQELARAYELTTGWSSLLASTEYGEAKSSIGEQLVTFRRLLGPDHPEVAACLRNFAILLSQKGDYAEADSLFREALAIRQKALGPNHPDVGRSLANLGALLYLRGDYAGAEPFLRDALAIRRKALGPNHPDVASSLNNLASLITDKGDYAGAEPLYQEALAIYRKTLGPDHPETGKILNNLARLLAMKGDYAGAEPLYEEALAIQRRSLAPDDPDLGSTIDNLGVLLSDKGDYARAEPLYREALDIRRKVFAADHADVGNSLQNLAGLLAKRGNELEAESLFWDAIAIYRKSLGPDHPAVALSLYNLGVLLSDKGDYARAEPLYREALDIQRKGLGPDHPYVGLSFQDLAVLLSCRGDDAGAEQYFSEAARVYDASRLRTGGGMERATFQESPYPALALARLAVGKTEDAWPAAERGLGRVLADLLLAAESRSLDRAEIAMEDSLLEALTILEGQVETLREARRKDPSTQADTDYEEARSRLIACEAVWNSFQARLCEEYPVTEGQPYPLGKIQAALDNKTAIVGWLDAADDEGPLGSWIYVIRHKGPVVWARLQFLGDSSTSAFGSSKTFREQMASPGWTIDSVDSIADACLEQWRERMAPIAHALDGVGHLVVIPSGAMLGIPLEALVDETGTYLSDRFSVSYTPSATIYTWLKEREGKRKATHGKESLLVGDPPFQPDQLAAMEKEENIQTICLAPRGPRGDRPMLRYVLAGNEDARSGLDRLPCTRLEVEAIAPLVPRPTLLVGPQASEQELVQLAEAGRFKNFRAIHLATHVLVDHERPERSALVLSLVNLPDPVEAAMKGERIYDGLVTAKEVLRAWKLDADLVTLSACETALGKTVGGEGYVGLAHAFLQAGARSLIVSLWSVEDQATSLFMKRFYENWTGRYSEVRNGRAGRAMSKADALQEAKRYVRTYTDRSGEKPFEHPYYWAAFVLMGER